MGEAVRRQASCQHCGGANLRIKATHKRTVKHTRRGNQVMILHLKVPKYHCQSCGDISVTPSPV